MTTAKAAVLVIDSDRKHLAWLSRIVRTVVHKAEQAMRIGPEHDLRSYDLIVTNYDELTDDERLQLFAAADVDDPEAPRLLLISAAARADYRELFHELESHGLTNVLAHDTEVSPTDLIVTIQKILKRDIFGLDKYFGWGVQPFATEIRSSEDVNRAVEDATEFATELGVHPRLVENLATVVHELVTNAVYNAPVDEHGAPRFAHLPRTAPVELEGHETVTVRICCDGQFLGVSVVDSFGAMTKDKTLSYLAKCLRHEGAEPDPQKGGAGLGLYMTFDSLNHLVLNVAHGNQTEVIGLMDIRGSYRDFVTRGKSFNIFIEEAE